MAKLQAPVNPILESIHQLFYKLECKGFDAQVQEDCKEVITLLANFFECKEEEAIVLALLVQLHYNKDDVSIAAVLGHLKVSASAAVYFNELLQVFTDREWLCPCSNVLSFPQTRYELNTKLVHCITKNDRRFLEQKETIPKNSFELLDLFEKRMQLQKRKKLNIAAMAVICRELLKTCSSTSLGRFLKKEKIQPTDIPLLLKIGAAYYEGKENIFISDLAQDFFIKGYEKYKLLMSFKQGTHPFIKKGLIEAVKDEFIPNELKYTYSHKLILAIDPSAKKQCTLPSNLMLEQIQPERIAEKQLIYEPNLQTSVEKLHTLLMPDYYSRLTDRFRQKGMKAGITVLIYGSPGTGKTETILQMSRQTGRSILMADASKIRDKWVGDTEKNIRSLFAEYKKNMNKQLVCPILLFNEADAVFSIRRPINDRVDQMENSLQNILLEELENFEGIFIATTNMQANFDKAYDRRFLYKLKFDMPTTEAKKAIWTNKFPDLNMEQLTYLADAYTLTGAQIENIRKKAEVDSLLDSEFKLELSYLDKLAVEELHLQQAGKNRPAIGFLRQ